MANAMLVSRITALWLFSTLVAGCDPATRQTPSGAPGKSPAAKSNSHLPASKPRISFQKVDDTPNAIFLVEGLPSTFIDALAAADLTEADWSEFFAVYVDQPGKPHNDTSPIVGSYQVLQGRLRFRPRYNVDAGVAYRAVFDAARLPAGLTASGHELPASPFTLEITLPQAEPTTATSLVAVYPTSDELPENQLKFYLHFSGPMSRGQAYRHITLLTDKAEVIEDPFLELGEELWDRSGTRFTLFFDPGRIKRGLKPREDLGPALEEGKDYVLVVDRRWLDAQGFPLVAELRKSIKVVAPDNEPPNEKKWRLQPPAAGQRAPLAVLFPEPLDRALLERMIWVVDVQEEMVAGQVQIDQQETRWQFTPARPWRKGNYRLIADTALEDRAGNSLGRPFEVDEFSKIDQRSDDKTVSLDFEIQ